LKETEIFAKKRVLGIKPSIFALKLFAKNISKKKLNEFRYSRDKRNTLVLKLMSEKNVYPFTALSRGSMLK